MKLEKSKEKKLKIVLGLMKKDLLDMIEILDSRKPVANKIINFSVKKLAFDMDFSNRLDSMKKVLDEK